MGTYLTIPNKDVMRVEQKYENISCSACSMQGWRKTMEDAHILKPDFLKGFSLFGVFDGHGGSAVANYVKETLPRAILDSNYFTKKQWKDCLINSFHYVDYTLTTEKGQNQLLKYYIPSEFECLHTDVTTLYKKVGCTACISLIIGQEIYVANAGDSRCVLAKKGNAIDMSKDHKPNDFAEKSRILKANGFVQDNRVNGILGLSRAIGDFNYKQCKELKSEEQLIIATPDIHVEKLTDDVDFMIIACDGIWECWESQKVVDYIYSKLDSMTLSEIQCALFDELISPDANTIMAGCDNMTSILISFKGHP